MIWSKLLIFVKCIVAQYNVEFREIYSPAYLDDLPFESVKVQLNEGIVRGRKISLFEKDIEVYRGKCYIKKLLFYIQN